MWPGIIYETCAWERDPDELALIPKSRRRKILPTYKAAVPASIATLPVRVPAQLAQRLAEVQVSLARFDQAQTARDYALPALLLRSESSSSSQIERLTSSVRNAALAELCGKAPANAPTNRAARNLVEVACSRGILAKMGNAKRGAFYQAPDLVAVLEEASSLEGIRRIAAR